MWKNYFYNVQKKYSMRISTKEPLVIRLDGKDTTKNKKIELMDKSEKSFMCAMEKSVEYFTRRYKCYSIYGSDEVSFIFTDPNLLIEDLNSDKDNHSNEIISVFSQYFFNYFNRFDENRLVFFHAKCFTIPNEKIISYIKYRSRIIENVMVTYFLKKSNKYIANLSLNEQIAKCKLMDGYKILEEYQKGTLYFDGRQIRLKDFIEDERIVLDRDVESRFSDFF